MARRARLQLGDVLHQLSDDEWAVDGSDDDLGMDYSYSSGGSDDGNNNIHHTYVSESACTTTIEQEDMDLDQPTVDPSSLGDASHSSPSCKQLLPVYRA